MQTLTLSIAALASALVLYLPFGSALAIYIVALLVYPVYLVVQIGSLDISVSRIVVAILLFRCLMTPRIRERARWCTLDSWVLFSAGVSVAVPLIAWQSSFKGVFENTGGHLMDTFFAYVVTRFCLTDRKAFVVVLKAIGIALAILGVIGAVESLTGWQSFYALAAYCPWLTVVEPQLNVRSGLYRAIGPYSHPILFGVALAMFIPLVYWLRHEKGSWRSLSYWLSGLAAVGVLSSMSSGPVMVFVFSAGLLILEQNKRWTKSLIVFLVFSCIVVSIISNRRLYHVIASYADPIGGSGWHRARLLDLAIETVSQWWLTGYGGRDPGWGYSLGMTWTDITNHYLVSAVKYGLAGVIALAGMLVVGVRRLIRLYRSDHDPAFQSWCWALGSVLIVLMISFNGFHVFGQTETLFCCLLGFVGSSPNMRPILRQRIVGHPQ